MSLGNVGICWSGQYSAALASEMEGVGYGALWMSGRARSGLPDLYRSVLAATERTVVVSGVINIWHNTPIQLAADVARLFEAYGGRFRLGLGASHSGYVESTGSAYERPYDHMARYLDDLDATGESSVARENRLLAALGPRMSALARDKASGAYPYFVPVGHVTAARHILGPYGLLAVALGVVREADPSRARRLARTYTEVYLRLPNYVRNLRRLGFNDQDVSGAGSDHLVDSLVAWGDDSAIARRISEVRQAGADHVCLQIVTGDGKSLLDADFPVAHYRRLASALALSP